MRVICLVLVLVLMCLTSAGAVLITSAVEKQADGFLYSWSVTGQILAFGLAADSDLHLKSLSVPTKRTETNWWTFGYLSSGASLFGNWINNPPAGKKWLLFHTTKAVEMIGEEPLQFSLKTGLGFEPGTTSSVELTDLVSYTQLTGPVRADVVSEPGGIFAILVGLIATLFLVRKRRYV